MSFYSRTFFTTLRADYTDSITSLSTNLPNPLSSSLAAHIVEIDNSESVWEAEAARAESLMSLPLLPCTGSSAKVRLFLPLIQPGTQLGNHGDVNRGMPPSVINWHGGVLVVAGQRLMLFAITDTRLYLTRVSRERQSVKG